MNVRRHRGVTDQAEYNRPWFDTPARLRELITELNDLTAARLEDDLEQAKNYPDTHLLSQRGGRFDR